VRLRTAAGTDLWLAYGMNVHPGGTPESAEAAIRTTVLPLRDRLGATGPFGISLRLDGPSVERFAEDPRARARFRLLLDSHGLVPFTANGFVVGRFHGGRVKDEVYRPSWRDPERLRYTNSLADLMASLRGPGEVVSISTAPGSWRLWDEGDRVHTECAVNLARTARHLKALEEESGTRVLLGIEPEPRCTIETTREALRFFHEDLRPLLAKDLRSVLHLGVCFDTCHQSVVHEDLVSSLALLEAAGIPVVKVQASSALEVPDPTDPRAREALAIFDEPTWLHQVGARDAAGARRVAADLPEVLGLGEGTWSDHRPWRVHFHVPVFRADAVPPLTTTRPDLERVLRLVARGGVTEHLEIETYTWTALPEEERRAGSGFDLLDALEREYRFVLSVLEGAGATRT
jgi:hypothetical protein